MGEAPDPNTDIVDPREGGQKLLQFLQRRLDLPPSLLHRWIRTGQVRINGGRAKPFGLVAAGDSVRLPPFALGMSRRSKATGGQASPEQEHEPRQRTQALPPAPRPLQKDGDLWVFCKPAGLPTHPGTGHEDSLSSRLAARAGDAPFKPTPVHRLDKDTSGLVLAARNTYAAPLLAENVQKLYYAIVEGELLLGPGVIDAPIGRRGDSIIGRCVTPEGKPSRTEYTILKVQNGLSLAACVPVTGRTHQIRVHFASIGHPLAGDDLYGGRRDRIGRQALHCAKQTFRVPEYTEVPDGICIRTPVSAGTGRTVTVESPLPQDMADLLS